MKINIFSFFSSCHRTKTTEIILPKKPRKRIFFDLDETLIVLVQEALAYDPEFEKKFTHLTPVEGFLYRFFLIHKEETAKLFKELLEMEDVEIAFITAGAHPRSILACLEEEYGLPEGSFAKCIFINRHSESPKGVKLKSLVDNGDLHKDDFVLLVDDQKYQNDSMIAHKSLNFSAIQATGFVYYQDDDGNMYVYNNPDYLQDIIKTVKEWKLPSPDSPANVNDAASTSTMALSPRII